MAKTSFEEWQKTWQSSDALLRSGDVSGARVLLSEVDHKEIPRAQAQPCAQLCVRAGLFHQALSILLPIVHPEERIKDPVTDAELATYALALVKIGSTDEALQLLAKVSDACPEKHLHTAFALQGIWDYEGAFVHLSKYLSLPGLSDYQIAVAEINLLAAMIPTSRLEAARSLQLDLRKSFAKAGWSLLLKNLQELSCQLLIRTDDLSEAKTALENIENEFGVQESIWDFFIAKWKAYVELRLSPSSQKAREKMVALRAKALELRHWESVRECDRALAQATQDRDLLLKVYFGTPYAAYRQSVFREAQTWLTIPDQFVLGSASGRLFDLKRAMSVDQTIQLKPGQALHRCLVATTADLYRPLYEGNLHAKLFPGEYFNPLSSPVRVLNVVKRFRRWLEEYNLPLALEVASHSYHLVWRDHAANFGLIYAREDATISTKEELGSSVALDRLSKALGGDEFSSVEAADVLQVSKSSIVKALGWGVENGRLIKSGSGRTTRYSFRSP